MALSNFLQLSRRLTALPFTLLCLGAFVGCAAEPIGSTEWAIVGGERTNMNEQATVVVLNRTGGLCTGTLIGPRVVLTAKHCVQNPGAAAPTAASAILVGVGDSIQRLSTTVASSEVWTTPGAYRNDGRLTGLVGIDIALLTLPRDLGVEPVAVYREHPRNQIGRPARAVGFGETPSGSTGVKYRTSTSVTSIMGNVIGTTPSTCQGDSGGPLFTDDNQVMGITSFGSGSCGSGGFNGFNRVDSFLTDIDRILEASGACVSTGEEICNNMDDNCDGVVDEGCVATGQNCADSSQCSSGRCEMTDAGRRCVESCDPLRPRVGCPSGTYCSQSEGCDGRCVPGDAGMGLNGAACERDTDCESLFCANLLGESQCLSPCQGGAGTCFADEICAAPEGACGVCVTEGIFSEPANMGEGCAANEECVTGLCLTEATDPYCSATCEDDGDCPSSFHCLPDEGVCARGRRSDVGQVCSSNGDCVLGMFCASNGSDQWCTRFCSEEMPCPENNDCTPVGDQSVCTPTLTGTGDACSAAEQCVSGVCEGVGAGGETLCTRFCTSDAPCEPGFICERHGDNNFGLCVEEQGAPVSGGGCAVATPTETAGTRTLPFLLVIAGALLRRRRRANGKTNR